MSWVLVGFVGIGSGCINHRSVDYAFWIVEYYGKFYDIDNAHIDLLEYLVTMGVTGCAAYVCMFLFVISNLFCSIIKRKEPGTERTLTISYFTSGHIGGKIMMLFLEIICMALAAFPRNYS